MQLCCLSRAALILSGTCFGIIGRATAFHVGIKFQPATSLVTTRQEETSSLTLLSTSDDNIGIESTYESSIDQTIQSKAGSCFSESKLVYHTFKLESHKPLGCTAEESLVIKDDGMKHVFISKLVSDGNAEKFGLQIGDVIVGVSGSFDDVIEVVGEGLEKVRNLIAGRNAEDILTIKVVRGTNVMSEHETTLIEQCLLEDEGKNEDIEKCIEVLYKSGYEVDDDDEDVSTACDDSDVECMLDQMYNVWDEDEFTQSKAATEEKETVEKKKPAPWSSRSSPSGTYVRDPKTGKMINIDE